VLFGRREEWIVAGFATSGQGNPLYSKKQELALMESTRKGARARHCLALAVIRLVKTCAAKDAD
jgi:hypothetical protein